jgi:uncharacterized protein YukE
MADDSEEFAQQTKAAAEAAGFIEKAATTIGIDGDTGHVGELKTLLNRLADEWHSGASVEHRATMDKWNASVIRLAELTKKIGVDLRGGTEGIATTAGTLNSGSSGGGSGSSTADRYTKALGGGGTP